MNETTFCPNYTPRRPFHPGYLPAAVAGLVWGHCARTAAAGWLPTAGDRAEKLRTDVSGRPAGGNLERIEEQGVGTSRMRNLTLGDQLDRVVEREPAHAQIGLRGFAAGRASAESGGNKHMVHVVAEAVRTVNTADLPPFPRVQTRFFGQFPARRTPRIRVAGVNSTTGKAPLGAAVGVNPLPCDHDLVTVHGEYRHRTRRHHMLVDPVDTVRTDDPVTAHVEPGVAVHHVRGQPAPCLFRLPRATLL